MTDPTYSFTLPSLEDDTTLDCRMYHAKGLVDILHDPHRRVRGAVLAHPYAPLGGSYDDHVVLSVTETLLGQGYVVATFNFRGAGGSHGRTSWTGRGEIEDYISITGFLVYHLRALQQDRQTTEALATIPSADARDWSPPAHTSSSIPLVLGGYSYGSLILAKLPSLPAIIARFQEAPLGTSGAEIILRARMLAKQTLQSIEERLQSPASPRGRSLKPDNAITSPTKRAKASPVVMGGEETDPSERRRSRDSRRSADFVHKSVEVPQRIKAHIRHHSDRSRHSSSREKSEAAQVKPALDSGACPTVEVSYLVISPVVLPFTTSLLPPGPPSLAFTARKGAADGNAGSRFLQHPTLAVFGTTDSFTSSRRLRAWAEKQASLSSTSTLEWEQIKEAGHFWREEVVMQALQKRIKAWTKVLP